MIDATVGQVMINELLPLDLQDYRRVLDKSGIRELLTEVADKHPEQYAEIVQRLHILGNEAATAHGTSASLSLDALKPGKKTRAAVGTLRRKVSRIVENPNLSDDQKEEQIILTIGRDMDKISDLNYEEMLAKNNPFALQVLSGSRGNKTQLKSLSVGDMLVVDHKDRPIPIPMISSYSDGLDPVQYWAGAYGARKGEVSKKFATPKAGFLAKQLAMAAHRLVVTEKDCGTTSGISVNPNNPDNEGAVLAQGVGDYEAGDVMTPKMGRRLWRHKRIVVRSPITCQARQGVCQKCAGVREKGDFPPLGDNVGMAAAQAIAEPISQLQLSAKHSGGVASAGAPTVRGFDLINQLVQVPKTFQDAAAIATLDGRVGEIKEAPQGGTFIIIGGEDHWVPPDKKIQVERGQTVEAGDVLSEGIPNPSEIVRYKGIGEGRRYFTELFGKAMSENNLKAHRRNIELLSRGLINHVRITDPDGPEDTIIDDVVEFDSITRNYEPRVGAKTLSPRRSVGLYLERPVLHYSIGTRVSKRVADNLRKNKINEVLAHQDKPSFAPEMVRAMETLAHSSDWQVRLGGFHLQKGFLESVHRGRKTEEHGISFIPSLAKGTEFGRVPAGQGY